MVVERQNLPAPGSFERTAGSKADLSPLISHMLPLAVPTTAATANSGIPGCTVADYCAAACSCPFALHRIVQDDGTLLFRTQRSCLPYSARIFCWHCRCRRPASRRLGPIRPRGGSAARHTHVERHLACRGSGRTIGAAPAAVQHCRPDRGTYTVSRAGQPYTTSDIDLHKVAYSLVIACGTATCTASVFESEWN